MTTMQNIPSSYHISKGADNIYYILNDGETYICKLSKDLSKAQKIATDKINKFDAFAKKLGMSATSKVYKRFKI